MKKKFQHLLVSFRHYSWSIRINIYTSIFIWSLQMKVSTYKLSRLSSLYIVYMCTLRYEDPDVATLGFYRLPLKLFLLRRRQTLWKDTVKFFYRQRRFLLKFSRFFRTLSYSRICLRTVSCFWKFSWVQKMLQRSWSKDAEKLKSPAGPSDFFH